MRNWFVVTMLLAPVAVLAQPAGGSAGSAATAVDLRKTCVDAMNADETFAASIVEIADKKMNRQRDDITLTAHQEAADRIAKNERHVIFAYAAMWVVAALFVLFLWRRQQVLKLEIARLHKDLAAATKDHPEPK